MSSSDGAFVELEFALENDEHPAIRISQRLDCRLELLDALHTTEAVTAFFHAEPCDPGQVVDQGRSARYGTAASLVQQHDGECILELTLERSPFGTLADVEIPVQSLVVRDGTARFVATVPPCRSAARIIEAVEARHPSVDLVGKHQRAIAPPFVTETALEELLMERLTDRQLTALYLAVERGYFERPRRTTQVELAEAMGISAPTYSQHLNGALQKLLTTLFGDRLTPAARPSDFE